jgi:hypothetical protein
VRIVSDLYAAAAEIIATNKTSPVQTNVNRRKRQSWFSLSFLKSLDTRSIGFISFPASLRTIASVRTFFSKIQVLAGNLNIYVINFGYTKFLVSKKVDLVWPSG